MSDNPAPWPKIVSLINRAILLTENEADTDHLRALLTDARVEALERCVQSHKDHTFH
ncbi:hypothetical protein [Cohaesibacter intestini]|uniref:hypothetical protein n=1 Tax=Cohaesibacter intestini TaxID=2211145 RepID=UPI0013002728|nr:hypothetical protein [Cohaesibacter intestini]